MSKQKTVYRVGDCEVRQVNGRNGPFEVRKNGRLWSIHPARSLAENEASREAELR